MEYFHCTSTPLVNQLQYVLSPVSLVSLYEMPNMRTHHYIELLGEHCKTLSSFVLHIMKKNLSNPVMCTVWTQEVVDDYTFECEVGGQAQRTKVSIFQSMGDPRVYGKIYCAKETKAEEDSNDLKLIHPP